LQLSPIIMDIGSKSNVNVVRCPMDVDNPTRGMPDEAADGIYPYSYQMNALDVYEGATLGYMTIIDSNATPTAIYLYKTTSALKPALKLLCAEPATHLATWDAPILDYNPAGGGNGWVAYTGRFDPLQGGTVQNGVLTGATLNNFLTCRHGSGLNTATPQAGQANVSFGDGHVAMVPWWFGTNAANVNPSQ
jgi:prepilin-type processing-associated H-X9-DG protein